MYVVVYTRSAHIQHPQDVIFSQKLNILQHACRYFFLPCLSLTVFTWFSKILRVIVSLYIERRPHVARCVITMLSEEGTSVAGATAFKMYSSQSLCIGVYPPPSPPPSARLIITTLAVCQLNSSLGTSTRN